MNNTANEISILEFLNHIKNNLKWLIIIPFVASILVYTGIKVLNDVKYETSASLQFSLKSPIITDYGTYFLPSYIATDYLKELKSDEFINFNNLNINNVYNPEDIHDFSYDLKIFGAGNYQVKFILLGKTKANLDEALNVYIDNFIDYLNYKNTQTAYTNFINDINSEINTLNEEIEMNKLIINSHDNFINDMNEFHEFDKELSKVELQKRFLDLSFTISEKSVMIKTLKDTEKELKTNIKEINATEKFNAQSKYLKLFNELISINTKASSPEKASINSLLFAGISFVVAFILVITLIIFKLIRERN